MSADVDRDGCGSGASRPRLVTVNLHDWIDELCDELDIEVDVDEALVLDLARDAAHNVERPAAPISTFLLGYAAAASGGDQAEVERLAGLATALALRWDKSPEQLKQEEAAADAEAAAVAEAEVEIQA